MTTFKQLQDEILQVIHGYGLLQPRAAFLSGGIDASTTSVVVTNASDVEQGLVEIDSELLYVESVNRSTNTLTIAPDGRGFYGTTAASHSNNARVSIAPVWSRNRIKSAINDTIASVYPTLFGVTQTQFTFNVPVTTYSIPAEAERILSVTADTNGPSKEQQIIRKYTFSSVAPTDDWATTNTLTLHEAPSPGKTVTVTYTKQPSALSGDSDQITVSGLRESAKLMLVYGATAQLLSFTDVARLHSDSAQADEFDERTQVGMASRVAGQLQIRFEMELEKERKRLREQVPPAITMRKR